MKSKLSRADLESEVHALMVKCGGWSRLIGVIITSMRYTASQMAASKDVLGKKRSADYFHAANGLVDCLNHMERLKL